MAKLPKCPQCGLEVTKDQLSKKYQNRTYHITCYKELMSKKYDEKKEDLEPRDELYKHICEIYGIEEVTSMMVIQIDNFMKSNKKAKYSGIKATLDYMVVMKEVMFKNNPNIIGLKGVIATYDEAKQYYLSVRDIHSKLYQQLELIDIDDITKTKVVKVKTGAKIDRNLIKIEEL